MRIGVLYEGPNDETAFNKLVEKIVASILSETPIFNNIPARGGIYTKINPTLKIFFGEQSEKVDLAILLSDLDKNPAREKEILDLVKSSTYFADGEKIICGFCNPHFEEWLIAEEDAIKNVLGYPASHPLPFDDLPPKQQLEKLIESSEISNDISLLNRDIYALIAEQVNIKSLELRSKTFLKFSKKLQEMLKC